MSVTALIGTNETFHCAGTGNYLVWEMDGLQARGDTTIGSGTVQSTFTVQATSVNNGTTVRCVISESLQFSAPAISNNATLTVLPGV